ncbi:MAG: hypothetical protein ACYTDW_01245 [Planctomycetota bacterium]
MGLAGSVSAELPAGWSSQDIVVFTGGSASETGRAFTNQVSGDDIRDREDGFQFVYKGPAGDGTTSARVVYTGQGQSI